MGDVIAKGDFEVQQTPGGITKLFEELIPGSDDDDHKHLSLSVVVQARETAQGNGYVPYPDGPPGEDRPINYITNGPLVSWFTLEKAATGTGVAVRGYLFNPGGSFKHQGSYELKKVAN